MENLRTGATKCLLVRPEFLDQTFYNLKDVYQLLGAKSAAPPLGLLTLAALLPPSWQLKLIDEDVEPVTDADLEWADIVMIGGIGPQELPMRRIAERAHAKGKPVVVGGAGPTLQPEIYGEADYVVCGEAEDTIPALLDDLEKGVKSGRYDASRRVDIRRTVIPRYDLARLDDYMFIGVGYSRGCPFNCEFCAQIEIFGRDARTKEADQVIAELQAIYDLGYRGMIDFGYDNLIGDIPQTITVLEAMAKWSAERGHPFFYSTEATINLAKEERVMQLMQENDFRYVFVGIESADDDVLRQTKKGQNTATPASVAVKAMNAYGLIVQTGLILGFDSETPRTAANMLKMVQDTGAFPALVLPLHALPNTQLARRLQQEGRLFGAGILVNTPQRTDTATTGLNFVTTRPRTEILADLAHVLEQLYAPESHYQRMLRTAAWIKPRPKYRPSVIELLQMGRAFLTIARKIGLDREAGPLFWKSLVKVGLSNPRALEMVIGQSVMNANYAYQAKSYVEALRRQIAYVERIGEEAFNAEMLAATPEDVQLPTKVIEAAAGH